MNLRADLIFPDEQRSASVISLRSITRIASIVGPAAALILIAFVVMHAIALAGKVKHAEQEWAIIEPRKAQALKVLEAATVNDSIFEEIESWKRCRVGWAPQLLSLQQSISPDIQLRSLRVSHLLKKDDGGVTARTFSLSLSGTAVGNAAEAAVEGLQKHFSSADTYKDLIASAIIPRYGADPDNKANRIFELECTYKPQPFK